MRIKKTSEVIPKAGHTVNVESDSTTNTYSCDYINDRNTYSTDEVFTGKYWIDGKKIYRKVITNISIAVAVNTWTTLTTINNLETLINITTYATNSIRTANSYAADSSGIITGYFQVESTITRLVVEYTKTTD